MSYQLAIKNWIIWAYNEKVGRLGPGTLRKEIITGSEAIAVNIWATLKIN
jgi:hypothetical protein